MSWNRVAEDPILCLVSSLSAQLREETAAMHREMESRMGLPGSILDIDSYADCLERFYRLYRPLERLLSGFDEWAGMGFAGANCGHAQRLCIDLEALGRLQEELQEAPSTALPWLPDFDHALGARYVLEGSLLGSQVVLRALREILGDRIAGADNFFRGYGEQTASRWQNFRRALDGYGLEFPESVPGVVAGAKATFRTIGGWMVA